MMDKIARGLGYTVLVVGAAVLLVVVHISFVEIIAGDSDDRKCQDLAGATGGTAIRLREWGDCKVEWEGFAVSGGRIERRYP